MEELLRTPKEEFEKRLERTQQLMSKKGIDGLVVFSGYQEREGHLCYLINHHNAFPNAMSHKGLGHSALVLPSEGKGVLVSPMGFEAEKVVGIDYGLGGWVLVDDLVKAIKDKNLDDRKLGVVGMDVVPVEIYKWLAKSLPEATLESANEIVENQRIIKSESEVELLRQAALVADVALEAGLGAVKPGASQLDVEFAARWAAMQAGADFIPRVRVSNGKQVKTLNWPMTGQRLIEEGDFVYLDMIGWVSNYGFDNSRVTVAGKPSDEQLDYLNHMVEATEWMVGALKPGEGNVFFHTESRTRSIIPFGHGIGLEIMENPMVSMGPPTKLMPNMVLCIEPILTAKEFGGMNIENTIRITLEGAEVLNRCPMKFW